jgi:hypothetical protein
MAGDDPEGAEEPEEPEEREVSEQAGEPAAPAAPGRPSVLARLAAEWSRKVGPAAATHRVAAARWMVMAAVPYALFVFMAVVAAVLRGDGNSSADTLFDLAWVAFALAVVSVAMYFVEMRHFRRAASEALGVPVTWKDHPPPPRRPDKYQQWCKERDLPEYPFTGVESEPADVEVERGDAHSDEVSERGFREGEGST